MNKKKVNKKTPKYGALLGLVFTVIGAGLLFLAFIVNNDYKQKNEKFVQIVGYVVDYDYDDDLKASIVQYVVDGKTYRKTSGLYSSTSQSKGTSVKLKYNPENPHEAIWVNDKAYIVMIVASALGTLTGLIVMIASINNWRKGVKYMD